MPAAGDMWARVRALWERLNQMAERPRVDYEALVAELSRAADERRRHIGQATLVPCDYLVSLSPRDMDDWEEGGLAEMLAHELERGLAEYIRAREYRVKGPITVRLRSNDRLDSGFVGLTPSFTPYDPGAQEPEGDTVLWPPRGDGIASFECLSGAQAGEVIAVTRLPATIGRVTESNHPAIGIRDGSKAVSRQHAVVDRTRGSFFITDVGSLNGTFVDGVQLTPHVRAPLPAGARVSLGKDLISLAFHVSQRSTVTGWPF